MAIDPKQLAAFAGRDDVPAPKAAAPAAKPMAKPVPPEIEEEEEPLEEKGAEGDLETEFPKLFSLLEEYGEEFEAIGEPMNQDLLLDESANIPENEEEMGLLLSGLDGLPEDLQDAVVEEIPHIEWDKATEIAEALEAGGHISNPDMVAGLLFHVGQLFEEGALEGEGAAPASEDDEEMPA